MAGRCSKPGSWTRIRAAPRAWGDKRSLPFDPRGVMNRIGWIFRNPEVDTGEDLRALLLPDGVTFTGEVKLVRKATGYEKSRRPTGSGFAGYASRADRHHSIVSVTHGFL